MPTTKWKATAELDARFPTAGFVYTGHGRFLYADRATVEHDTTVEGVTDIIIRPILQQLVGNPTQRQVAAELAAAVSLLAEHFSDRKVIIGRG